MKSKHVSLDVLANIKNFCFSKFYLKYHISLTKCTRHVSEINNMSSLKAYVYRVGLLFGYLKRLIVDLSNELPVQRRIIYQLL